MCDCEFGVYCSTGEAGEPGSYSADLCSAYEAVYGYA